MLDYPTMRFIFDRKKKANETAPGEICLEINYKKKRKFISTGLYVLPKQWSFGNIVNHSDMRRKNAQLRDFRNKYEAIIDQCVLSQGFDLSIFDRKEKRNLDRSDFLEYISQRIEERGDIKESTKKSHRKLIPALIDFQVIEKFADLTKKNILKYDEWLHRKNYTQTTIYTYHKLLKTYIHDAIIHDRILIDPYLGLKFEKGKHKGRKYLTEEEILKIRSCNTLPPTLDRVRDLFVFQCYTGLAYSDQANLDASKLIERNGKYLILDRRVKTDEEYYIVLLSPALEVLKKYDFKLPVITNQQYNLRLQSVAAAAGLDKKVTSHMGRHSFAVLCLNKGLSMESVSKMLGHTNTNTTHVYAKLLNSKLEKDYESLEDAII